jgi:MFS family permease
MNDMNETVNTFRTNSIEVLEKKVKKPPKNKANKGNYLIRYLIFFNFMFLGFVNHLGYYLILTSSQQFATKLGNESLIACYPLALIIFSSLTRLINSKYCLNISYYIRIIILSVQFFIGYISFFCILAYNKMLRNKNKAFWLSMIPTTLVGISESFGEVTVLGYVGTFKGNYISGWNIGSALAGVCGTFLSLLFKKLNTNLKYVYLFLSPIAVLYLFVFMLTNLCGAKEKKKL